LRSLAQELERLDNHTGDLGALSGDMGYLPTQAYCGRLRGDWLNMTALLCGNRFGRGFVRPGGVAFELNRDLWQTLRDRLLQTARDVRGALKLMWNSSSVMSRLIGIGAISRRDAQDLGLVGVAARAAGLMRDARHTHPLPELPQPPEAQIVPSGDVYARAKVRDLEITASVGYCRRLLEDFLNSDPGKTRQAPWNPLSPLEPDSIAAALVEGWRGEICHAAVTDSQGKLRTLFIKDPSFHNWMGLAMALRGQQISDFPLCNKSFNLSYCGHDL
jgi:Ni,Fe-hydrogenase III large subunit